jgi:vacuolar-type H+-ATPase subunit H
MADYKDKFEEWQRAAKDKFEEIDKQFGIKEKLEEGVKVARETAQKGAETLKDSVDKIKVEVEKSDVGKQAVNFAEDTFKTAETTAKTAWDVSEPIRDVAEDAGERATEVVKEAGKKAGEVLNVASERASEVFEEAASSFNKTTKTASDIFNFGSSWAKTLDSAYKGISNASAWIAENPLQAATSGISMVVGAGLGAGFTLISSNWFFQSALPFWTVEKIGKQFQSYLKSQEELIKSGELSEADAEKIKFEREIVKFAGAPLLGAFSFGAGAMMFAQIFNPRTITGAPISWILMGNPLLEGIWLFGNGLVCFKVGYEFFMISLEDQDDVQKIVKEIKGLLPQAL